MNDRRLAWYLSMLYVAIAGLFIFAATMAGASAQTTSPSMDETTEWLQNSLPTDNFAVDWREGLTAQYRVSNHFVGCIWSHRAAIWYGNVQPDPHLQSKHLTVIRFQPRAGFDFPHVKMTGSELAAFMRDVGQSMKTQYAYNDSVHFANVRLDSFTLFDSEDSPAAFWQGTANEYAFVSALDTETAQRYLTALRHLATLCGAKNDTF